MLCFSQLPGDADVAGSWTSLGVTKTSEADWDSKGVLSFQVQDYWTKS